jgi:TRAP-type C4-dicarboxylate transport system permease small subunit
MLDALDRLVRHFLFGVIAVMVVVVSAQVFARYVLNSSIGWADEVARLTFVWCVFLGMAVAVRAKAHIGLDLLTANAIRPLRAVVARAAPVACAALSLLVAWEAATIAADQWDERMMSLELSSGWFLVPVGLGALIGGLHFMALALSGGGGTAEGSRP